MDEHTLYAARDPHGVRPLSLGRLDRGWVVASETAAFDIVGASFVRDIEPGELLAIDADGVRANDSPNRRPAAACSVRLPRPTRQRHPRPVREFGPRRYRAAAGPGEPGDRRPGDPGPRIGHPRGHRLRPESGIPYRQGLMKNAYVGRTFIQPSQTIRQLGIRLKLNPLREVIRGKRLVVVDDSIVRGNTQRALIRMLREAGAAGSTCASRPAPCAGPALRHRLRLAGRTHRQRHGIGGRHGRGCTAGHRRRLARLHQHRGMVAATEQPAPTCARPASTATTRSNCRGETSMGKAVLEQMLANAAGDPLTQANDNVSAIMRP